TEWGWLSGKQRKRKKYVGKDTTFLLFLFTHPNSENLKNKTFPRKKIGLAELQEVVRTLLCLAQGIMSSLIITLLWHCLIFLVYTFQSKKGLLVNSTLRALHCAEQCGPCMLLLFF